MKLFDRLVIVTTLIGVIIVSIIICFLHNSVEEVKDKTIKDYELRKD